ncbi:glycolipid transfer protein domain-containing protein [Coprinopsis sp. MPI-PUGE-AT-0042]|nr:glycolipid transfer protein domain-containing protein [Coprinopsis sp. MPI-PUGE-AT-0042]
MAPYLDTVKSFADVPITDAGVETASFLEASEGLVGLFDILGNAAFAVVQADLRGNITKIKARYDSHKAQSDTLENLVINEKGEKKRTATEGLMWLLRGLAFTCQALLKAQKDATKELAAAFTESYTETLAQYHNFVVKGIFKVAIKACPYKKDFYAKLAHDPAEGAVAASAERVGTELDKWLAALDSIVQRLHKFYVDGDHWKGL